MASPAARRSTGPATLSGTSTLPVPEKDCRGRHCSRLITKRGSEGACRTAEGACRVAAAPAPAAGATTSDGPHSGPSPSLWRAFWKGLVGPALAASWGELAEGRRATHGWRRWLAECFVWAGLVVSGFVAVVAVVDATAPDPLRASTPIAGFVAVGLSIALINVDGAVLEVPAAILGVGCHREAPSAASRLVACVARLLRMLAVWYLAVFLMALAFAALGIW